MVDKDVQQEKRTAEVMTVVCAWCKCTIRLGKGELAKEVSHGICLECFTEVSGAFKKRPDN